MIRGHQPETSTLNAKNPPKGSGVRSITHIDVHFMTTVEIERHIFLCRAELMSRQGGILLNGELFEGDRR